MGNSQIKKISNIFYFPWLGITILQFVILLGLSAIVTLDSNSMSSAEVGMELILKWFFPVFCIYVIICGLIFGA
jgi:hypothetical protein